MLLQLISLLQVYLSKLNREEGQGMAEYALIIALVAIALVGALTFLAGEEGSGTGIWGVFENIVSSFAGTGGG